MRDKTKKTTHRTSETRPRGFGLSRPLGRIGKELTKLVRNALGSRGKTRCGHQSDNLGNHGWPPPRLSASPVALQPLDRTQRQPSGAHQHTQWRPPQSVAQNRQLPPFLADQAGEAETKGEFSYEMENTKPPWATTREWRLRHETPTLQEWPIHCGTAGTWDCTK